MQSSKEFVEMEIQLHLAEYNALTARATYFLNIQNILLTVLVAWIGIMANIFFSSPNANSLIVWGGAFGLPDNWNRFGLDFL